ncbi:MAG TPA: serine/threonine protein kinase, partial [Cyanobacteria bacterium UBA8543]|nr:serine/threonine protein kinase [Cyanobacteria bacterium UBA8543]
QERYQLQQQLGRTAAGRQTWLAKDLQSNEQVTLKLLAFAPQMQWEELKLFEREAQVLQALNHPRIPRYRDYFSLDRETGAGIPWFGLVQDYIPGFSLQELLEQGKRFKEKRVRTIAADILKILIYLHELSPPVLHRDIKPSNLILGEDKEIYLVDFGAVQAQAAVTGVTFTVVGTSGYAPLEQFWGRAVASSDLYALGATLIHLLTGTAPADLPQKDSRIQFSDKVSLKPSFVSWIENMTEIAIEKRYSTARQALEALESRQLPYLAAVKLPTLGKIPKPYGTYIKIKKSAEKLKIRTPAPGLRNLAKTGCIGLLIFILMGSFLLSVTVGLILAIMTQVSLFHSVVALGLLLPCLAPLVIFLSVFFGERTYICFDQSSLEIERETLSFKYGRKKIDFRDISGVLLYQQGNVYQVTIRSHYMNYQLGGALGEDESAWLAQEIQDWLNYRGR